MDDGTHAIGVTVFPSTEGSAEAPGAPPEVVGGAEGDTVERDAGKQKRMAFPGTFEAALQWAKATSSWTLAKAGYKAPTTPELEALFKEHPRAKDLDEWLQQAKAQLPKRGIKAALKHVIGEHADIWLPDVAKCNDAGSGGGAPATVHHGSDLSADDQAWLDNLAGGDLRAGDGRPTHATADPPSLEALTTTMANLKLALQGALEVQSEDQIRHCLSKAEQQFCCPSLCECYSNAASS